MKNYFLIFAAVLGFSLFAGLPSGYAVPDAAMDSHAMEEAGHAAGKPVTVLIQPTKAGAAISGKATLAETPEGLKIEVEISGAPSGTHGIHIHEKGSCADKGNAAGGHFNPDHVAHGDLTKDGFAHAHAGDLGNIEVDAKGNGKIEKTIHGLTLAQGKYGVAGRSIIVHEKADNFGQPTGNAGGRIACGVISKP